MEITLSTIPKHHGRSSGYLASALAASGFSECSLKISVEDENSIVCAKIRGEVHSFCMNIYF